MYTNIKTVELFVPITNQFSDVVFPYSNLIINRKLCVTMRAKMVYKLLKWEMQIGVFGAHL